MLVRQFYDNKLYEGHHRGEVYVSSEGSDFSLAEVTSSRIFGKNQFF